MDTKSKTVTVIENAQIVLENGILWDGVLLLKGDRILKYGSRREMEELISAAEVRIDAKGAYVGPGFVDIHVHGGGGFTTYFNPVEASDFFLRHGTTSLLATIPYDLCFTEFLEGIRTVKENISKAKTIRGFYMEGPYLNADYGSHSYLNTWRGPIEPDQYKILVEEAGTLAKIWTIAPERMDLVPFLEYARKINPETIFAVGHSEATPAQIRKLGKYRPALLTHAFDATGRVPVASNTRGCGPDEYCMNEVDMYAELISDSRGNHVNAELQRLLLRNKGVERTILITDSCTYENPAPVPPEFESVTDLEFDDHGCIAGSKMTMDMACRNIMTHTNCGISQAFLMASRNPAHVIGMDHEIGTIEAGKRADLVFVDDRFHVQQVMLGGELCYD